MGDGGEFYEAIKAVNILSGSVPRVIEIWLWYCLFERRSFEIRINVTVLL